MRQRSDTARGLERFSPCKPSFMRWSMLGIRPMSTLTEFRLDLRLSSWNKLWNVSHTRWITVSPRSPSGDLQVSLRASFWRLHAAAQRMRPGQLSWSADMFMTRYLTIQTVTVITAPYRIMWNWSTDPWWFDLFGTTRTLWPHVWSSSLYQIHQTT